MSGLRTRSACIVLMLAAMAPLLAGCNEPMAAAATAPAEPEVGTFTVRSQARAVIRELPGRIAPTRVADVRARVSGIVVERLFQQGTEVKAGDPLYRIDSQAVRGGTAGERSRAGQGDGRARSGQPACAAHRDADQSARGARGRERKGHRRPAPGRGRGRQPQGRSRARQAQSRLRDDPCADQRRRRRGAGERGRAGGPERDRPASPRSSSSIRSMPISPNRSRR